MGSGKGRGSFGGRRFRAGGIHRTRRRRAAAGLFLGGAIARNHHRHRNRYPSVYTINNYGNVYPSTAYNQSHITKYHIKSLMVVGLILVIPGIIFTTHGFVANYIWEICVGIVLCIIGGGLWIAGCCLVEKDKHRQEIGSRAAVRVPITVEATQVPPQIPNPTPAHDITGQGMSYTVPPYPMYNIQPGGYSNQAYEGQTETYMAPPAYSNATADAPPSYSEVISEAGHNQENVGPRNSVPADVTPSAPSTDDLTRIPGRNVDNAAERNPTPESFISVEIPADSRGHQDETML